MTFEKYNIIIDLFISKIIVFFVYISLIKINFVVYIILFIKIKL